MTKVNYKKEYQEAYILVPRVKIQEVKEKTRLLMKNLKQFLCVNPRKRKTVLCVFFGEKQSWNKVILCNLKVGLKAKSLLQEV